MVTQVEAGAAGARGSQCQRGDGNPGDPAVLAATLVAALEQALLAAQRLLGILKPADDHHIDTARPTPYLPGGGLSRREAEVLRQLAAGQSTRQIAQALFLSPRTVQRHVANVYLKIGTHCRAGATAYALRHDLA